MGRNCHTNYNQSNFFHKEYWLQLLLSKFKTQELNKIFFMNLKLR